MLRTVSPQPTLWESVTPECLLDLPGDLAEIDALLDDPRFFEPFRACFDPVLGRPSIPMETYLRMMFLKSRYRLGFEPLCREVARLLGLAAILSGAARHPGAAPDHADEDHVALR